MRVKLPRTKVVFEARNDRRSRRPTSSGEAPMAHSNTDFVTIAEAFVSPPLLRDEIITSTSEAQDETLHSCLPFLKAAFDPTRSPLDFNQHGVPRLNRNEHVRYLERALEKFPASYVGLDSSRPWMVYWGLMGLVFLGEEVESFRER